MKQKDLYDEELKDDGNYGEIHELASSITIIHHDDSLKKGVDECEEPGCSKPAEMSWHGRRVCNGHYNGYKAKEESLFGKGFPSSHPDSDFGF